MANASKRIKIASASLNLLVYDLAHNFKMMRKAIDLAAADHADILATPELSATGYEADDYHQWNKNNDAIWAYLRLVAAYANQQDPNLVVTVGVPWHYRDTSKPANDPAYNINRRPFNTHVVISGGKILSFSAKSILADGPAEYEPRQFNNWPLSQGTIAIPLPDGSVVPFGKPVVHLTDDTHTVSLTNEICAEGWPGVHDDLTINAREQAEARHIVTLAQTHDLSIVLNPSASKPEPAINKERIRAEGLCKTGSRYCGAYVYTNILGSASGTYAAEGSQIFAQDGEIIHHGERYSFQDVSYSSAVVTVPAAQRGTPHASTRHQFSSHADAAPTGREAVFDAAFRAGTLSSEELTHEEFMRSLALWLRDYLSKQSRQPQGCIISLSGGRDSAYGAIAVTTMIDLDVRENGIKGFFQRFHNLKYRDEIIKIEETSGTDAARRALKNKFLTCVYLPTENSSAATQAAARFLIEGGKLNDGTSVEGIGGFFYVAPVQGLYEEAIAAYSGLDLTRIARTESADILGPLAATLPDDDRTALARSRLLRTIMTHVNATPDTLVPLPDYIARHCIHPLPSWANPADDLTLQNLQARIRLPLPWTEASHEGKIPFVTSNETEAVLGYTTAGGDMHMGGANLLGGIGKHIVSRSLAYFEQKGLMGLPPVRSLALITQSQPSAELRKAAAGQPTQTDEGDLGFSYDQAGFIIDRLIVGRQTPTEVQYKMAQSPLFPQSAEAQRTIINNLCGRWEAAQFKRIMGTLAPYMGSNVDPHQSVRTTVLGDHFHTACAQMTVNLLLANAGSASAFHERYGISPDQAKSAALFNPDFRSALIRWDFKALAADKAWQTFAKDNAAFLQLLETPATRPDAVPTPKSNTPKLG